MRMLLSASLAVLALCAGCGQKGPLVRAQKTVATPVVIRAPAADAPAVEPAAPPAEPAAEPPAAATPRS